MLIGYESEEKILDTDLLDVKMKELGIGISNISIEEKAPVGRVYNVEIYFNSDIPIPQMLATTMLQGQKIKLMKVLTEIRLDDKWTDVRKTFPTICQAEKLQFPPCTNRSEEVAIFRKDGKMTSIIFVKPTKTYCCRSRSSLEENAPVQFN
jgi:hypothetical protein